MRSSSLMGRAESRRFRDGPPELGTSRVTTGSDAERTWGFDTLSMRGISGAMSVSIDSSGPMWPAMARSRFMAGNYAESRGLCSGSVGEVLSECRLTDSVRTMRNRLRDAVLAPGALGVEPPMSCCVADDVHSRAQPEFFSHACFVCFDGFHAQTKCGSNLLVAVAASDAYEHLTLTLAEWIL